MNANIISSNPELDERWNQALESYLASTDRGPEDKAVLKKLHSADDLYYQLEASHRKFGDWRNKHSKFFSALSKAVKPFVLVSGVAQCAVSPTPFAPASAVLDAVLFLVKAADGVSEAYDWIEQLFDKLSGFTQRLEEYLEGGMSAHLQQRVIAILSCLLGVLGESEKVIRDGRFRKYAAVLFLGRDERVKASFDCLAKLFDDEQRLVLAISYATNQRIDKKTDKIDMNAERTREVSEQVDKKLDKMSLSLQEVNTERRAAEQKALLEKNLDTPARLKSVALYSEYTEDALKSSGQWLLDEEKVPRLDGAEVTDFDAAHPNRVSVGFFYVKEHDQDLQDLANLLKSIAYQIASVDAVFQGHALKVLSKPEATISSRKIWENLFLNFYCRSRDIPNAAMIVIDGLDEAPKKTIKELFRLLEDLTHTAQVRPRLSFALFGRPELAEFIEPKLQRTLSVIEVGDKNEADIGLFIKEHVTDVLVVRQALQLKTKKAARKLAREIRDKIMAKADGMFFKVVLIMNQLYNKERTSSVFEAIDDAPPQLEAMIGRVFGRLALNEDVNKDDLNEILIWVAFSKRPLTIAELYTILKARTGQAYDALEGRLRGRFASLFKLTRLPKYEDRQKDGRADENDTKEDDRFDIDLLSDEDDTEEDISDETNTGTQCQRYGNDAVQEDGLNRDTVNRFRSIGVRFTHASIRGFLVKDRSPESRVPPVEVCIGIDSRTADMHNASMCMQSILDYDFHKADCEIVSYAAVYFMDHLMSIEASKISTEDKQLIIHQLCRLFLDPVGLRKLTTITYRDFNRALHKWFENPRFSTTIRRDWLNSAIRDQYTTEEWEWISNATSSRKEFFAPLATEASRMWLTKSGNDDPAYYKDRFQLYQVWIVHCYLNVDAFNDQEVKNLDLGGLTAGKPPAYKLEPFNQLVGFSNLAKTQHWHTCFAWILKEARLYEEAMGHFNQALEIDKTSWKALQGKSKCLTQQGKYDEAAQNLLEALKLVPDTCKSAVSDLQSNLTKIILAKMDFTAALQRAQDIYSSDPTNSEAIVNYIQALYALRDHDRIVAVVEELREVEATSKRWADVDFLRLSNVHHELGCALRTKDKLELVRPWVDACSSTEDPRIDFSAYPWLAAWIAEFTYSFYDEPDESMRMFEYILSPKFKSALGPELTWAYSYPSFSASNRLSQIYFQKAVSAHKAGEDAEPWIRKLKALATSNTANSEGDPVYKMNDASLLLGMYLRRYGGATN